MAGSRAGCAGATTAAAVVAAPTLESEGEGEGEEQATSCRSSQGHNPQSKGINGFTGTFLVSCRSTPETLTYIVSTGW